MFRIHPIMAAFALTAFAAPASAQISVIKQERSVYVYGICCGLPAQTETRAEAGDEVTFDESVSIGHFESQYQYFEATSTQRSTILPTGIAGNMRAVASDRGTGQSSGAAACDVTFSIPGHCTYTFTANAGSPPSPFTSMLSLSVPGVPGNLFSFAINNRESSVSDAGSLEPGVYLFHASSWVDGNQFSARCEANFSLQFDFSCPCDWNGDHALNSADFFDFLADFFAFNADFNDSGATNSADFFDFLSCFFTTCD